MSDDLISRQAAYEALQRHEKSKGHNYSMFVDVVAECEEIILDVPPAEPQWIPVTERLPEPNKVKNNCLVYYLVQNEYGDMMVAAYRRNRDGETWWEQMYAYKPVEDEVIAWMPLPTPWKGESDATD